jgi:hypothetical protein
MIPCTTRSWCGEIEGIRNFRIGSMIREVFSEEKAPVDIRNVNAIQRTTGNQYVSILREVML